LSVDDLLEALEELLDGEKEEEEGED